MVTLLYAGKTREEIAATLGVTASTVTKMMQRAANKIGGPPWAGAEKRCLIWKAMEVGVLQYLAGVRGADGRLLAPPPHSPPVVVTPT